MAPQAEWVWMPHPAHFICSRDCKFHLATYVGGYIVSTVGEYVPDAPVREILAKSRGVTLNGLGDERLASYMFQIGFEEIGAGRTYETMVFPAGPATKAKDCGCAYKPTSWSEVASRGYTDATAAVEGHLALCHQYASQPTTQESDHHEPE